MTRRNTPTENVIYAFPGRRGKPVKRKPLAPLTKVPEAPSFLSDAGRAEFERAATLLVARRVLCDIDLAALAAYADAHALWCQAAAALKTEEPVIASRRSGVAHANPWVNIARTSRRDAMKYGREFGLTPSARGLDVSALDQPTAAPSGGSGRDYFD